eukprot:scaffold1360_cov20-Tisochrysis_lutea.AAC.1
MLHCMDHNWESTAKCPPGTHKLSSSMLCKTLEVSVLTLHSKDHILESTTHACLVGEAMQVDKAPTHAGFAVTSLACEGPIVVASDFMASVNVFTLQRQVCQQKSAHLCVTSWLSDQRLCLWKCPGAWCIMRAAIMGSVRPLARSARLGQTMLCSTDAGFARSNTSNPGNLPGRRRPQGWSLGHA